MYNSIAIVGRVKVRRNYNAADGYVIHKEDYKVGNNRAGKAARVVEDKPERPFWLNFPLWTGFSNGHSRRLERAGESGGTRPFCCVCRKVNSIKRTIKVNVKVLSFINI